MQRLPPPGVWLGRGAAIALCIVMAVSLLVPAAVHFTGNASDTSALDNRPHAPVPDFPTDLSIKSLDRFWLLRKRLSYYIDVAFGLRVELVTINAKMRMWMGLAAADHLIAGRDGWQFLKTADNVLDQYRGVNRFTDAELDAFIDTWERRQKAAQALGQVFVAVIAPNPQTIYFDYMPAYATRAAPTRTDQLVQRLKERNSPLNFIDLRQAIHDARMHGARLYNQYENHWNRLGAFIGYGVIMQRLKEAMPGLKVMTLADYTVSSKTVTWAMPPASETVPELTLIHPQAAPADAPSLVIYGDSFLWMATDYFRPSFRAVETPINTEPYPASRLAKERPDVVVFEMVERYMALPLAPDQ